MGRRFRMQALAVASLAAAGGFALWSAAGAQEIPRDQYLHYLPLSHTRLVPQTEASAALHLFGDAASPSYRDVDPVDGIDDERHRVLHALAVRFAPYLVQGTASTPLDFRLFIANRDSFALHVDTWDVGGSVPALVKREEINLSLLGRAAGGDTARAGAAAEDSKLRELLWKFAPGGPRATVPASRVRVRPEHFEVLFLDFPGDGPESWRWAYEEEYRRTPPARRNGFPHAFVHPFVHAVRDSARAEPPYELVLQYWLFYPSNDGANNHEGDWEHINVAIAPRDRVATPLLAADIDRMLRGDWGDDSPEAPVIHRVEYYFHHFVMTLDYSDPNVYLPRDAWQAAAAARASERLGSPELWKAIRRRAYTDDTETVVETHPIGYIGADNKGLDQVLVRPGGNNRDSHGTYPFSGRYHDIGAASATEQVSVHVDAHDRLKTQGIGKWDPRPTFRRGDVIPLNDSERVTIVPDWERLAALAPQDAAVRSQWSWLLLPLHWGYPASESPMAGIVEFADTGNQAPVGPAFSGGWNASGAARGFAAYEPHALPSIFPLGLQDSFRNDLGWLNATYPVFLNIPPFDFASRIVGLPVRATLRRQDPVFYPKEGLPYRFVGLSAGMSAMSYDDDYGSLMVNPQQLDAFIVSVLQHLVSSNIDSTTAVTGTNTFQDGSISPFLDMSFYVGRRFVSQNMVRNARSRFGLNAQFNNIPAYAYAADLNLWEYAGSIRFNLAPGSWQPYAKGGYGWTWTRVENAQANGVPFEPADSDWISPSWWPNTWQLGAGLEYAPWKRVGRFPHGAEFSLRLEYVLSFQELGLDLSQVTLRELGLLYRTLGDVPASGHVIRHSFLLGATLSF